MKTTRNQLHVTFNGKTGITRRNLLGAALTAAAFCATMGFNAPTAHAQRAQLKVYGKTTYINGVNMAWIDKGNSSYGHDIGYNAFTGYSAAYNSADVDRYFRKIKSLRCNVARVWLFEGLEGLTFDRNNGYVTGVDAGFKNNLNDMLTQAKKSGIALQLCLVNHLSNEEFAGNRYGRKPIGGGVPIRNFITESGPQKAFLDNAVSQIVRDCLLYNGNPKSAVFGIDVINEPQFAVTTFNGEKQLANWTQLHNFIYNVANRIHGINRSFQVGCDAGKDDFRSSVHYSRLGGTGLDYYAYHEYSNNPSLPNFGDRNIYAVDKPMLLGEFNASNDSSKPTPTESQQASSVDAYLNQASYKGYAGALVWSFQVGGGTFSLVRDEKNLTSKPSAGKVQYYGNKFGINP